MADYLIEDSTMTAIANAIRTKDGTTAAIKGSDYGDRIRAIPSGAGEFFGYKMETGTVVVTNSNITIPHSLGSVGGFILCHNGDIGTAFYMYIPDIIKTIAISTTENNQLETMEAEDIGITNNNSEVTLHLYMTFGFGDNDIYSYILLGA